MSFHQTGADIYVASTAGVVVAAAGADPFFLIEGSATKDIKIHKIIVSGATLADVEYLNILATKYSTAASGGVAVALTKIPVDSVSPASTANLVTVYTTAPTPGTAVGTVQAHRVLGQDTTAAAAGIPAESVFDFITPNGDDYAPVLRGVAQGLGLRFGTAPAGAVTLAVSVIWSEERTIRH